jgi:enoyl-CoA hydratase/carnithine racemase
MSAIILDRPTPACAVLTLNRPARLNALSFTLIDELHRVLDALERDNSYRVVVLTGAGRGFCSGLVPTEPAIAPPPWG